MPKRKYQRRFYSEEFKEQMIKLYQSGKTRAELIKTYDLTASAFDRWVKQDKTTGSFKTKDNLTEEQVEVLRLKKENKKLKMEVDILKQATLIMGRKEE